MTEGYSIYTDENQRSQMVEISRKLAEYIVSSGFENVVFVDRSARNVAIGVSRALLLPDIYNLLSDKIVTVAGEDGTTEKTVKAFPRFMFINPAGCIGRSYRNQLSITEEVKKSYKGVDRNAKTLVVDTCTHTGETFEAVFQTLADSDFTNLSIAVVSSDRSKYSSINPDFSALGDTTPIGVCYPFNQHNGSADTDRSGRDKNGYSVHSSSAASLSRYDTRFIPAMREHASARDEIRRMVSES